MDWSLSSYDNLKIKISTENAQQYVALQEEFLGDRILDARNLEKNLQPESLNYNLNANLNAYRLRIYLINTNIIF